MYATILVLSGLLQWLLPQKLMNILARSRAGELEEGAFKFLVHFFICTKNVILTKAFVSALRYCGGVRLWHGTSNTGNYPSLTQ
jgi:hypothetical protein